MKLVPSVTRVVISVSRAFCSTDQEKRDTPRSLILEMSFGHHIVGFPYQAAFEHSIHLVWTKIESEIEGDDWEVKITLTYDESLLSDQPPWGSLTSRYHGSKKFLDLNNFSWQRRPFALLSDGRKVWVTVLFLSAIMHRKVIHVNFFFFFFSAILAGPRFVEDQKFSIMATWRNDYSPSSSNTLSRFKCIDLLKKRERAANRRVVRQPRSLQSSYL